MPRSCRTILGTLTLVSSAGTLVGLWLEGQKGPADIFQEELEENPDAPVLAVTRKWLNAHFAGERPAMADIPLAPAGSPFRQAVWKRLQTIPYGECVTSGQIARELAAELHKERMASQALAALWAITHFHHYSLPPRCRLQWQPDRLCGRH